MEFVAECRGLYQGWRCAVANQAVSTRATSGWSIRSVYSARGQPRGRRISQVPNASVSGHAMLLDPAAVPSSHRLLRLPFIAFQIFDPVGLRMSTNEAESLHLRCGPPVALPTLSSCCYLHAPKARLPVGG
jgi:hypothetical protein